MTALPQLIGGVAIALGLLGTWLAGQRRTGWLVCIVSSTLWLPALLTGDQWAAVLNCGLSIGICVRNFRTTPPAPGQRRVRPAAAHPESLGKMQLAEGKGFEPLMSLHP
jgi:hypothetical protein